MGLVKSYTNYCQEILSKEFQKRQSRNPTYSVRAFARDMGISKTTISEVMNGYRKLSPSNIAIVTKILKLDKETEIRLLSEEVAIPDRKRAMMSEEEFKFIKDWHYLAILNLAKLSSNKCDPKWIAERLVIPLEIAESSLKELLSLGLLEDKNGKMFRTMLPITANSQVPSESIREHHRQSIVKSLSILEEVPIELRDYTTVTYVLNPEMIPVVKAHIQAFHRKLGKLLPVKNATDVYRLNLQFFPLTDVVSTYKGL